MGRTSAHLLSVLSILSLLALLSLFVLPVYSTSRQTLHHQTTAKKTGFRVTLHHVDHGMNLTKLERLQRGIKRGKHRVQRLNAMVLAAKSDSSSSSSVFESPVRAGNGEFLMQLSIGTPPNAFSAIMDTGSDLIWTQCLPCETCFDQPTPIFDPRNSSSFSKLSCSSQLCEALPQSTCSDGCEYFYGYGDYSSTQGVLATETFAFGDDVKVLVNGIGFGCGGDNEGDGFSQGAGLVGLGRGPLSLVSQLKEPKFSYCLTSMDDTKTSSLLMGSLASVNTTSFGAKVTTPLMKNPSQPSFYYLSLEGISVGGSLLSIEKDTFALQKDGSGGLIIDSGTTITYLEKKAFDIVKEEFTSQINLPVDKTGSQGLDLCFNLPKDSTSVEVPKLSFHFKNDAVLELPPENYILSDSTLGVLCLALGSSSGMSIFGNIQQQNLLVVHDLSKETLSFVPTQCDQL
ncbi:aspartic proteinase nepenthesin-1 [Humulus lupulus]|uniref:aspartic proteinase nepenthesin-1 n=1 Tax=Humulus lupulus TaxID=3486 RepID=UPI002B4011E6|nr:aspartic proteinase nepenthesin-1 [Humulus lupulus]